MRAPCITIIMRWVVIMDGNDEVSIYGIKRTGAQIRSPCRIAI